MILRLLIFLALGFGLYFIWRWKNAETPEVRRKLVLNLVFWGLIVVIIALAATGRIHWLGAAFAGILVAAKQLGLLLIRFFPALAQMYGMRKTSQAGQDNTPAPGIAMSESEACKILEIEPGADIDTIKRAHRSQMRKQHPDHGGNPYFAAKLNEARDFLIEQRKKANRG